MINFNFIKNLIINIGKKKEKDEKDSIEKAAKSIDDFGRFLMHTFGRKPKGERHFNSKDMSLEQKMSVQRLVDLNIIRYESESKNYGFDSAHHWTEFGDKVMKYLGIIK